MKFQSKCLVLLAAVQSVAATSYSPSSIITSSSPSLSYKSKQSILANIRGGAVDIIDEETPQKKNKATKSSKTKGGTATQKTQQQPQTETNDDDEAKVAINTAMKDSDTAHTLGEAIRARAHILRQDKLPYQERTFDSALVSLGLSLGTAGLDVDLDEDIIGVVSDEDEEEGTDKEEEVQHTKKSTMMAYYQYGHRIPRYHQQQQNQQFVQPSTSAVIANYFLKTHGGTHLLQCVLSLLASVLGMICLMLPSFPSSSITTPPSSTTTKKVISSITLSKQILQSTLKYQLLQQTLLIAMTKHISAIVGAVILGAQSIPTLGIRNARYHLEMVALDPVGQYLFYCSILVVWLGWFGGGGNGSGGSSEFVLGLRRSVISIQNTAAASAATAGTGNDNQEVETISQLLDVLSQSSPPWFLSQSHGMGTIVPIIMLTPILLREVISIIWVVSDVLSLALTSSSGGILGKFCQGILSTARSILDTFMSLVISSDDQWKKADSFQRQRTLARLVSQTSLVLELIVGVVLFGDAIQAFGGFSFGGSGAVLGAPRLPLKIVVGKMVCAHLYINFLLSRRRKIHALVGSIRSSRERNN